MDVVLRVYVLGRPDFNAERTHEHHRPKDELLDLYQLGEEQHRRLEAIAQVVSQLNNLEQPWEVVLDIHDVEIGGPIRPEVEEWHNREPRLKERDTLLHDLRLKSGKALLTLDALTHGNWNEWTHLVLYALEFHPPHGIHTVADAVKALLEMDIDHRQFVMAEETPWPIEGE
jgi:hypothetical protein